MKPRYLSSILLLNILFSSHLLYSQAYKWVKGGATNQSFSSYNFQEEVSTICTDPNGNVFAMSIVGNSAIIADTFSRPTGGYGSVKNVLFTSHNCNGQMRFGKLISCNATTPYGVACDNAGHVYIALDLPHSGSSSATTLRIGYDTTITGNIYNRVALIQYDTNGHLNWVRFLGENLLSTYTGMGGLNNYLTMDGSGNAHLVANTEFGVPLTPTLVSHWGFYDHTYDATGNLLDIKKLNLDTTLTVYGLAIDKQSNKMYAHGYRNPSLFPGAAIYSFLTSLDLNRNIIWIDTFANPYYPGNVALGGIATDGYGHLYITPNAARSFVFRGDTSTNVLSTGSSKIAGIMKLDTAGNIMWKSIVSGNTGSNSLYQVTMLPNNKVATCGLMTNKIVNKFDTMNVYVGEGQNAYIFIVDTAGYTQTLSQLHGPGFYDRANVCAADNVGNLYVGGKVETNIWGGSLTPYSSVGGDSDYFIMKYGVDCSCTAMPVANYTYTGSTELTRNFSYTGTAGVDSVRWYFGDGTTSTSMSPVHTYTGSGTFTTCVRAYNNCGSDMRCYEVTVSCLAAVSSAYNDTGNIVHGFTYTGTTANYDSVVWDFDDGTFDTGMHVIHTYAAAGTYHVCAKVYTKCDTNTFCKDIIVTGTAVVSIGSSVMNLAVYPNPVTNDLVISSIPEYASYRLMNAVGTVLRRDNLHAGTDRLSTDKLPSAMYVLEVTAASGEKKVFRIVKQ